MSKKFMENAFRILKSVYYMEKPEKITKDIKKIMTSRELAEVMIFLENKGLIQITERKEGAPFQINLTDKGTEYFTNELNRKKQEEFNQIIAFTGAIIALITIYGFLKDLGLLESFNWITVIFLLLVLPSLGIIIAFIINSMKNTD